MAVFDKIMNSMERVIRDWAVTSVASFRGHQAKLVETSSKQTMLQGIAPEK